MKRSIRTIDMRFLCLASKNGQTSAGNGIKQEADIQLTKMRIKNELTRFSAIHAHFPTNQKSKPAILSPRSKILKRFFERHCDAKIRSLPRRNFSILTIIARHLFL